MQLAKHIDRPVIHIYERRSHYYAFSYGQSFLAYRTCESAFSPVVYIPYLNAQDCMQLFTILCKLCKQTFGLLVFHV